MLGDEIDRPRFDLRQDLADILAHDADHEKLHAADHHDADDQRRIARDRALIDDGFDHHPQAEQQRARREQHAEQAGDPQRRDREGCQSLDRQAEQAGIAPARPAMLALGRLVIDPQLAEADPGRETLEEAVALGQLAERRGRARREQAEIAGVLRDLLPRAPVDQGVEAFSAQAPQRRLVGAAGLGGVDDVVALVEPMADQPADQRGRMLAVGVHEQHRAAARMVETGHQRGFLAEIARQRDHLHIDAVRRQAARDRKRVVAAAVVHIDDLAAEPMGPAQVACRAGDPLMQRREAGRLVVDRHDDGQAGFRRVLPAVSQWCRRRRHGCLT